MANEIKLKVTADTQEFEQQMSKSAKETEKQLKNAGTSTGGKSQLLSKSQAEDLKVQQKENKKLMKAYEKDYAKTLDNIEKLKKQHQQAETKEEKKELGKRIAQQKEHLKELQKMEEQYSKMGKQDREISTMLGGSNFNGDVLTGALQGFKGGGIKGAISGGAKGLLGGLGGGSLLAGAGIGLVVSALMGAVTYLTKSFKEVYAKQEDINQSTLNLAQGTGGKYGANYMEDEWLSNVTKGDIADLGVSQSQYGKLAMERQAIAGNGGDLEQLETDLKDTIEASRITGVDLDQMNQVSGTARLYGGVKSVDEITAGVKSLVKQNPKMAGLEEDILETAEGILSNTGAMIGKLDNNAMSNVLALQSALADKLTGEQLQQAVQGIDNLIKNGADGSLNMMVMSNGNMPTSMEDFIDLQVQLEKGITDDENIKNLREGMDKQFGDNDQYKMNYLIQNGLSATTAQMIVEDDLLKDVEKEEDLAKKLEEKGIDPVDAGLYMSSDQATYDQKYASEEAALTGIANYTHDILGILQKEFWSSWKESQREDEDAKEERQDSDGDKENLNWWEKRTKAMDEQFEGVFLLGTLSNMLANGMDKVGEWFTGEDEEKEEEQAKAESESIDAGYIDSKSDAEEENNKDNKEQNGAINGNVHRMFANGGMTTDATTFTTSEHDQPEAVVPISNAGAMLPFGESMLHAMESKARKSGQGVVGGGSSQAQSIELEARNLDARDSVLEKWKTILTNETDNIKRLEAIYGVDTGEGAGGKSDYFSNYTDSSSYDAEEVKPETMEGQIDVNVSVGADGSTGKILINKVQESIKAKGLNLAYNYKQGV